MVWEIVDITGMSKKEVLEQVYPDELEYIFRKKREKEIQRYEGYQHLMIAVAAGFGAETEDGESLYKIYNQQLDEIIEELKGTREYEGEKKYTPEDIDRELEKLKGLQEIINQTQAKKKRPGKG